MREKSASHSLDVIVVGGGPAGLNAALLLGRTRRRTLVLDSGDPRNAASHEMHGYLSRDGLAPAELRRLGRAEVEAYPDTRVLNQVVAGVEPAGGGFDVATADGQTFRARKLLLAVGMKDELPAIPGLAELYGTSVYHCPYCDGFENRDRALALLGNGSGAVRVAKMLLSWSDDVLLCTGGPAEFDGATKADLATHGITLDERPVVRLLVARGKLSAIEFADGATVPRDVLFFHGDVVLSSSLPSRIGCALTSAGRIEVDEGGRTSVPGVYAAGDAARRSGQHPATQVIVAAASGSIVGITIHQDLLQEDVGLVPALPDLRVTAGR